MHAVKFSILRALHVLADRQSCNHHHNEDRGHFHHLQSSLLLLCGQFLPESQPQSVFRHCSPALSGMLCDWNHTAFSFLNLASLVLHKASEVRPWWSVYPKPLPFSLLSSIPRCGCASVSICSPAGRYLGCCQFGEMIKTLLQMSTHRSVCDPGSLFLLGLLGGRWGHI